MYILQTDTENSASDVGFGSGLMIITDDDSEAYKFFAKTYIDFLDEDLAEFDAEHLPYNTLTEEEKFQAAKRWFTETFGMVIHQFPVREIQGLNKITDPLQEKISALEKERKLSIVKRETPLIPEIVDVGIGKYL